VKGIRKGDEGRLAWRNEREKFGHGAKKQEASGVVEGGTVFWCGKKRDKKKVERSRTD